MTPTSGELIPAHLGQPPDYAVVAEQTDRASRDPRALLVGLASIAMGIDEELPELLVAEATDRETRIGNRRQEVEVLGGGLEGTDAATAFAFPCCDGIEDRPEGR